MSEQSFREKMCGKRSIIKFSCADVFLAPTWIVTRISVTGQKAEEEIHLREILEASSNY